MPSPPVPDARFLAGLTPLERALATATRPLSELLRLVIESDRPTVRPPPPRGES